jgi:hypothetical protein
MLRELFDLKCSVAEESLAAICIIRGVDPRVLALEPELQAQVARLIAHLREIPTVWCKEIAHQTLLTEERELGV